MTTVLYCDLETFCETPILYGSHRYAERAEVLLWGYAVDDKPARVWDLTVQKGMPEDLRTALNDVIAGNGFTVWHNGMMFDTVVLEHALGIRIPIERVVDTMVMAYQHGLPGSLGALSEVLRLPQDKAKDKEGKRLVQMFCKPLPVTRKIPRATRHTHPQDWAHFVDYCRLDVEAEREVFKRLPKYNITPLEKKIQMVDARINRRGMQMDIDLAKAAVRLSADIKESLDRRTSEATGGVVEAATQRDKLIEFIRETYGWDIPTMTKAELEKRLGDPEIPEPVRELLGLRLLSTRTSVKKFEAIINCASTRDGRLRGTLQFRGAARTGRFAGRLFQPQNLPRPSMSNDEIELAIALAKDGDALIRTYDDPSSALSQCLRGEIIAPEGKKLVVADYSNVEGRVLAWLAGEDWKLKAFREFDAGHGFDLYKLTYARAFNVAPETVTKPQRQMGKVLELAMGYQGGVGAFVTFARGYGINLDDMATAVRGAIDPTIWHKAADSYEFFREKGTTHGLARETFIACDAVKRAWRIANAQIVDLWAVMDEAIRRAMTSNETVAVGKHLKLMRKGNYLLMQLPSGRYLCYPSPRLPDDDSCTFSFMGVEQYSRKWTRIKTFGGRMCIAEGTLVVTDSGLKPIETVTKDDLVWDGVEWVSQEGAVYNGNKEVIKAYGAWMTEDHLVLSKEGWIYASEAERHNRANCRLPNGCGLRGIGRKEKSMESAMRLWQGNSDAGCRTNQDAKEGSDTFLRMHEVKDVEREAVDSSYVKTSRLGCVAFNETTVRVPNASCLEQLWRAWHQGLRKMVVFVRGLLGGHGTHISEGSVFGSYRQQRQLRAEQLSMGHSERAGEQHPQNEIHRWVSLDGLGEVNGHRENHAAVQVGSRMSEGASVRPTGRISKVYDLVNAGPRNRYVIIGDEGPVIAHNCENATQAVAGDLLCESLVRLEDAGFETVLTVHDEVITEAPDKAEFSLEKMAGLMTALPAWANGLPLAAAGFEAYRYRKD